MTMTLDELATSWLSRRPTIPAALPGLNNDLGAVQVEVDPVALKHPCFPPFSAGNEVTGLTLLNGRSVAQLAAVEVRWLAYRVDRRCTAAGWRLTSRTTLLADAPGAVVELTVVNTEAEARDLDLELMFSGRARNHGSDDYSWAIPSIPTDVFNFCNHRGLRQHPEPIADGAGVAIANEEGNAWSLAECSPKPAAWRVGRCPSWHQRLPSGGSFTITVLQVWHAERPAAEAELARWRGRWSDAFAQAQARWEALWRDAFTPGNPTFSGHLPALTSRHRPLEVLYHLGVLTLLTCRRRYRQLDGPSYLTLWPRRGEGSVYLAWDLACTGGLLARLDPQAAREQWRLLAEAPELDYQVTNLFNGTHGGWACSAQPHSLIATALHLERWAGDSSWRDLALVRRPKARMLAASQGFDTGQGVSEVRRLDGGTAFNEAVLAHRRHRQAGSDLVDFGQRHAYLECITTYAHGTAGHTAVQAWALAQVSSLAAPGEEDRLIAAVCDLYRAGEGHFDCRYPDGSRVAAPNLYDLGLVLSHLGHRLPPGMAEALTSYARSHLLTATWAHSLWPGDPDAASGVRCDHQWAGCFGGWPALFALGVCRSGTAGPWLQEWLTGVSAIAAQGPVAQAYWADDVHPTEAGAAAKCYDELTQGNHWAISSGALFAEMVLDGILGLHASPDGLTATPTLPDWAQGTTVTGIACGGRSWTLRDGRVAIEA